MGEEDYFKLKTIEKATENHSISFPKNNYGNAQILNEMEVVESYYCLHPEVTWHLRRSKNKKHKTVQFLWMQKETIKKKMHNS